jgi:hypothetical protein
MSFSLDVHGRRHKARKQSIEVDWGGWLPLPPDGARKQSRGGDATLELLPNFHVTKTAWNTAKTPSGGFLSGFAKIGVLCVPV